MHSRMDAAGAVDAQNAPTAPWKTAQNAVFHSAHTLYRFSRNDEENRTPSTSSAHEIPDSPLEFQRSTLPRQFAAPYRVSSKHPTAQFEALYRVSS